MVPADEVIGDIIIHFVCCNSAIVMKIGPLWEDTDAMVKFVRCGPGLWVVL